MKGIINGSRQGIRAARGLAVRCSAQVPAGGVSSSASKVPRLGSSEGPNRTFSSLISFFGSKRNPTSYRMFSSGGGGGSGGAGGGGNGGGGGAGGLWVAYLALLERKPVFTKSLTAAILNGFGDVIAQYIFKDGEKFTLDVKRLGIFTFLGFVMIGPALHVWYGSLSSLVSLTGTPGAIARMAMDQLLFAPVFVGSIVAAITALEGHADAVPDKIRNDLFTIIKSNWAVWVPFQFLNFRFVPVNLQVLASNVVALGWNTYMSWASHNSVAAK